MTLRSHKLKHKTGQSEFREYFVFSPMPYAPRNTELKKYKMKTLVIINSLPENSDKKR